MDLLGAGERDRRRRDELNVLTVVLFGVGLILLAVGANGLVRGAVGIAARFGVPPLVIGLTVVAFGTSSPEVLVSLQASLAGDPEIALGNVVGSNIFNVLFILGLSAAITPLVVSERLVRRDVPVMIGVSLLVYLMSMNGRIGPGEGIFLLAGIILYVFVLVRRAKGAGEVSEDAEIEVAPAARWWVDPAFLVFGLALQVVGARWLVSGAITIATSLGVSELVIGLTIVAAGTSLPEVATSVAAAMRGQRDIAVGNVVGSNIFNLLLVLGIAGIVAPSGLEVPEGAITFDLPVMLAVALACLPIFVIGYSIKRWEGVVFLGYYVAYTVFLGLDAAEHTAAPIFGDIVVLFVLPLTVITFIVVTYRTRQRMAGGPPPGVPRPTPPPPP
jgi:cation:H+ antiporter